MNEQDEYSLENTRKSKIMKQKFLRELEHIKLQKNTIERERIGFMYEKYEKPYKHLEEIEKSFNRELQSERLKLEHQLKKIKGKVHVFQQELRNVKATPEFVERLKITMEDIESTIGDFKQKQKETYESLMICEKETEQELSILKGKIDAVKDVKLPLSARLNERRVKQQSNFPDEIQQFETYVAQNGGLQGGWDDYDHGAFLRIRDKYKGNKSFICAASRQIPGRSQKDIEDHEKWYAHFIELKRKKKDAIEAWRRKKEEKENLDENQEEDEESKKLKEKEEENLRKKIQQEREIKKEELRLWKIQKMEKQQLEEERKVHEEKLKEAAEKRKRKEKEAATKAAREILKQRKEDGERLRWIEEFESEQQEIERQQEIRDRIAQFQNRDRVALNLKQIEQKRKEEIENIKKEKLEKIKSKVEVERDPTRLYRMTEGWVNRTKDASENSTANAVMRMPHRAIPTWRQNL